MKSAVRGGGGEISRAIFRAKDAWPSSPPAADPLLHALENITLITARFTPSIIHNCKIKRLLMTPAVKDVNTTHMHCHTEMQLMLSPSRCSVRELFFPLLFAELTHWLRSSPPLDKKQPVWPWWNTDPRPLNDHQSSLAAWLLVAGQVCGFVQGCQGVTTEGKRLFVWG